MQKIKKFIKTNWAIILIFLLGLILRLAFLGLRPFDGDEGVILKIASSTPFKAILGAVSLDVHPPLYHLIEAFFLKIFGLGEFSARLFSAFCASVLVIPVFAVFKRLSNQRIALSIAVLTIFSSVLAYHGAEVRPYSLFTLLFFTQLYFFLLAKDNHKIWQYILFSLASFLLIFCQYLGFVIFVGELFYLIIFERKSLKLNLIISVLASIILFIIFWGNNFYHQLTGRAAEQSQVLNLKANIIGLINAFYRFAAGRLFLDLEPSISKNLNFLKSNPLIFVIFVLSIIVPLFLIIYGAIISYKKDRKNFFFIVCLVLPYILVALFSAEVGPRASRYLSFLVPFYLYFLAVLFFEIKSSWLIKGLFIIFLAIYMIGFINGLYFERKKPGVNAIAAYLKEKTEIGNAVLIKGAYGGGEEFVLRYYLGLKADELKIVDIYQNYSVGNLREIKRPLDEALDPLLADGRTIWFYDFSYSDNKKELDKFSFEEIKLGKDKENKEIVLYQIK